jgi:hypothetical protein
MKVILTMGRWQNREDTQPSGRAGLFYRLARHNASARPTEKRSSMGRPTMQWIERLSAQKLSNSSSRLVGRRPKNIDGRLQVGWLGLCSGLKRLGGPSDPPGPNATGGSEQRMCKGRNACWIGINHAGEQQSSLLIEQL